MLVVVRILFFLKDASAFYLNVVIFYLIFKEVIMGKYSEGVIYN